MKIQLILILLIKLNFINGILRIVPDSLTELKAEQIRIRKPSIEQIKRNLWYAIAVLCNDTFLKDWDCKLCNKVSNTTFIKSFSSSLFEVQGYVAIDENERSVVAVFRGADGLSNFYDTVNLLSISTDDFDNSNIRVHHGFYRAMNSLSEDFLTILNSLFKSSRYKDYNLKLIGHSFGGALASLAMIKIQKYLNFPWENISLFTYGQPRIGNTEYAKFINSKPIYVARVVDWLDPVPRLPFRLLLDYTHHGNEFFIAPSGRKFCSNKEFEDTKCGLSVPRFVLNPFSHLIYMDTFISRRLC